MLEPALSDLVARLRAAPAWQRKKEIALLDEKLIPHAPTVDGRPVLLGDDAAAIEVEDGYLLLAAEVMFPPFVQSHPYLAGNYSVLANVNDIYAMGGRPLALVDVVLAPNVEDAAELLRGLRDGCSRYGIALVGGHITANGDVSSLAACILGRAKRILSSFDARPGDVLLHATSLRGRFHTQFPFWNCSEHLSDEELRRDLGILPALAEEGLCDACRDVSMAGVLGSTLMLLEPSGVGAEIDLAAIPKPAEASGRLLDWLMAFPSYGFVLSVRPENVAPVQAAFHAHSIACAAIGVVTGSQRVILRDGDQQADLWDLGSEPFIGFSPIQRTNNGSGSRR